MSGLSVQKRQDQIFGKTFMKYSSVHTQTHVGTFSLCCWVLINFTHGCDCLSISSLRVRPCWQEACPAPPAPWQSGCWSRMPNWQVLSAAWLKRRTIWGTTRSAWKKSSDVTGRLEWDQETEWVDDRKTCWYREKNNSEVTVLWVKNWKITLCTEDIFVSYRQMYVTNSMWWMCYAMDLKIKFLSAVLQQKRSVKGGLSRFAAFPGARGLDSRESPPGESLASVPVPGGPTKGRDQVWHFERNNRTWRWQCCTEGQQITVKNHC